MNKRRITAIATLLFLLAVVAANGQQRTGSARSVEVSPVEEAPEPRHRVSPTLISMEAYREVLASGAYILGPGDEFLVYISGMDEPLFSPVMAEGGLFIPGVGAVHVAGLSLKTARSRIDSAFAEAYQQGRITVELRKLRSLPVAVLGAVGSPGMVVTSGVERVSEVIRKAGDLGSRASRRNIQVIKTGQLAPDQWARLRHSTEPTDFTGLEGVSVRVDLELFNVTGDSRYNPFIEDGDRVIVPVRTAEVAIRGSVNRDGFFEYVSGDRIGDLLALAQGVTYFHDPDQVFLFRKQASRRDRQSLPVDLKGVLAGDPAADVLVHAEDWLVVRERADADRVSAVRIYGEVTYPGFYLVEIGVTRLRDVIQMAGGFTEDASMGESRVVRSQQTGMGMTFEDPEFERISTIPVADRTDDENQYFIMKSRERPGQMVADFLALFERGDESQNIEMLADDVIYVPRTQRAVVVSGQAAYPGALSHHPELTVWDYIDKAGGLGWRASRDIRVIKARTGETLRAADVEHIDPGDRIWIREKPQRDYWELFKDTMTVLGELSTMVLVYHTLVR